MDCPTVRIKATSGSYPFTTINESDFDPAKHEQYVESETLTACISRVHAESAAKLAEYVAATPDAPIPKRGRK